jgi:anthranilate synthase component 1
MPSKQTLFPDHKTFAANFGKGVSQLIGVKLIADMETPVSAMLKLQQDKKPCFLLESVQGGETRGRYSVIGIEPDIIWRCKGGKAEINRSAVASPDTFTPLADEPLQSLKALLKECAMEFPEGFPPMSAGLIGYMGYDMVRLMETLPTTKPDVVGLPDACFMRPQVMLVFDTVKGEMFIITPAWKENNIKNADKVYDKAEECLQNVIARLQSPLAASLLVQEESADPLNFTSNTTREEYHAMVERAKEYIRAGDIFQVVPSQRFKAPFTLPAFSLYRSLRHLNPSPFLFYLNMQDFSSPEILVRLRDGKVTIRPIAGTRKRGATEAEDKALEQDLLADPKEIAEHLMLLDLGRNDVGRIAKIGSVQVTGRMFIERYSHVMHIVSNVEGDIDPRYDAIDALAAGFPAGTVSGAPKIRAMEIIDELEKEPRSFYAGCVGYFSANGTMDTCITLRTGLVKDETLYVQAGGGVVVDSDPESEYQESCNKACAVMRAAEEAKRFV